MLWAGSQKQLAGARATLATGVAIFFLPFSLGSLADLLGIQRAFLIVGLLFVLMVAMLTIAVRLPLARASSLPAAPRLMPVGSELASDHNDPTSSSLGE